MAPKVYKILYWSGYYKPLEQPRSKFWRISHQIYRPFAFFVAFTFNLMHLVFAWQHRDDMDELLENMIIEIPQLNLLTKLIPFNFQNKRIEKLNTLLKDPTFAANNEKDEELLTNEKKEMHRLSKVLNIGVTFTGLICWPLSFFVQRLYNENAVIPAYVPFETTSWSGFSLSVAAEVVPIIWTGYGHIALDCVAVTYYSQICIQLQILKNNLENLFDTNIAVSNCDYKDVMDNNLHRKFAYNINRYEKLICYSTEVNKLFNFSMSFQFITSSTVLCSLIYKISKTQVLSAPFMFQILLMSLLLAQVFLYCFYGNLVRYESESVNRSIYLSDWSAVSPSFRKQILVAVTRWSVPIGPKVCGVIPLSLQTFTTILRSSYTLYTVLITKKT